MNKSNSIELVKEGNKIKTRIKPVVALSEVFSNSFPVGAIKEILDNLEDHVRSAASIDGLTEPNSSAFSNTRGNWFEMIVSAVAWNFRIENGIPEYYFVKMPNVKVFELRKLFHEETQQMLTSLEKSLKKHDPDMSLALPNPDLLILQNREVKSKIETNQRFHNLALENTDKINLFFNEIKGECPWQSIRAGIGLTTSLRPDRRLQLVHEGNILKSIFAHLKMRNWNNQVAFKYHGASSEKHSVSDDIAFRSPATHTIVNVDSIPERAVDELHSLLTIEDIYKMLDKIIKK
jgi:hypothetical protein